MAFADWLWRGFSILMTFGKKVDSLVTRISTWDFTVSGQIPISCQRLEVVWTLFLQVFVIYCHSENSNENFWVMKEKQFLFTQCRGSIHTVVVRGVALESLTEQRTAPCKMTERRHSLLARLQSPLMSGVIIYLSNHDFVALDNLRWVRGLLKLWLGSSKWPIGLSCQIPISCQEIGGGLNLVTADVCYLP